MNIRGVARLIIRWLHSMNIVITWYCWRLIKPVPSGRLQCSMLGMQGFLTILQDKISHKQLKKCPSYSG